MLLLFADPQNHPNHDNHNHIVAQGRVLLGRAEGGARYYGAGTKKFLLQILFRISIIIIVIIYCVECFIACYLIVLHFLDLFQ